MPMSSTTPSNASRCTVLLFVGVLGTVACSTDRGDAPKDGSLSLALRIADGSQIDEVRWEITGGDMDPMSGAIRTGAPGATASVEVFGIPEGERYLIKMEARATGEEWTCSGSAVFDIAVGEVTAVEVMLNCKRPPSFGGVRVNGELNHCATLVKVVVAPLQTTVGQQIELASVAIDEEDDPVTYMWSAGGGTIANPGVPSTTYTCRDAGEHQVRAVVSDDLEHCMSDWTVAIDCIASDSGCATDSDCDDRNDCTADICQADGSCVSLETPNDGNSCRNPFGGAGVGICSLGICYPVDECSVDQDCPNTPAPFYDPECTAGFCSTAGLANSCGIDISANAGGACDLSGPGAGDGVCNNGGKCTGAENLCFGVQCPFSACTLSRCNEETGRCEVTNRPDGTDCSAALPPLGECQAGVCTALGCSSDLNCDDGVECTFDTCDIGTGLCVNSPREDGVRCVLPDVAFAECLGGRCAESACASDDQCDPPTQCTARGVCNLATGACATPVPVENGDPCQRINGAPGVCIDGFCGCADDFVCPAGNQCRADGVCEVETGLCKFGPPINEQEPCNYRSRGLSSGRCESGSCQPACIVSPCPDNGIDCMRDLCSPLDGSCNPVNEASGLTCTIDGLPGTCDGAGSCNVDLCRSTSCPDNGLPCVTDVCDDADGACKPVNDPEGAGCVNSADNPGVCDGAGTCNAIGTCPVGETQSRQVTVACSNSMNTAQSVFPYVLRVTPTTTIGAGQPFSVELSGFSVVPEFFLDAAQGVIPGGVREATIEDLVSTVSVRSGATGSDVPLRADRSMLIPGPTRFCTFPTNQICASDEDCVVAPCLAAVDVVDIPTSEDCAPGGLCDAQGKLASQCEPNGFCVTGFVNIPLETQPATFSADGQGLVHFGWAEGVPGESSCPNPAELRCSSNGGFIPDGAIIVPSAVFDDPVEPIGVRVNVNNALFVPLQCTMAEQGGACDGGPLSGSACQFASDCQGAPCLLLNDVVVPHRDGLLVRCAID